MGEDIPPLQNKHFLTFSLIKHIRVIYLHLPLPGTLDCKSLIYYTYITFIITNLFAAFTYAVFACNPCVQWNFGIRGLS
jgi:hypothetical protein